MQVDVTPADIAKIKELWFEDGGVIVQAQNTLFRLSRGVLTARSPIFMDLFSIPQPADAETMDGCPVVIIPDAAEDATVFFKAIFDSSFFEAYPAVTDFSIVAGVLRLSTKYEVEHLRRRALVHLSSRFPTKLANWDARNDDTAPLWNKPSWEFDVNPSAAISLIDLCRETRAPWVLPIVFYLLGSDYFEDLADILHGVPSLDTSNQISFLKGYVLQRDAARTVTCFLYDPPAIDGCTSRKRCAGEKLAALNHVRQDCDRFPAIPLGIWTESDWSRLSALCATCLPELRKAHEQARQDLWARIPEMYSLPPWEELEKLKQAAIGVV
ncbi:hypothetical protein B0H19DRAFT_1000755 [Mycena capillaripes]|nr:hypothetical protein B0H19DRAFT_1000755 [Mycena capillaripes]